MPGSPEKGSNRSTPEVGDSFVEGGPQTEAPSQLALITAKLEKLATEGRGHYAGQITSVDETDELGPQENVVIYVGLQIKRPKGVDVSKLLKSQASNLAEELNLGRRNSGWMGGDISYGTIRAEETLAERTLAVTDVIKTEDMSDAMRDAVESTLPIEKIPLGREIQIRLYIQSQDADAARRLDSGEINRKGLRREERQRRHPFATEVFRSFMRKGPQQPQR